MLEALLQNTEAFIQGHARLLQMRELLGKNEQLTVRNFQRLRRNISTFSCDPVKNFRHEIAGRGWHCRRGRGCHHRIDANGNAVLLFDLANGDTAIGTVQNAFD